MANTPTPKIRTKKAPQAAPQTVLETPNRTTIDPQSAQKLKQSLGYIVATIVLALAGYFGWTYWQNTGRGPDTVAADKYALIEEKNQALQLSEDETARQQLNTDIDALVAAHGDTVFAWQALMIKANNAAYRQDYATAVDALEKAESIELPDAGLMALAQLRYATILLAKGDVDKAMSQASKDVPMSFESSQQELLGDIYLAKNDKDSAIRSYNNAWAMLVKRKEVRPILRLKLESLGIQPESIAPSPQVVSEAAIQTMIANMDTSDAAAVNEVDKEVNNDLDQQAPSLTTDATDGSVATDSTLADSTGESKNSTVNNESPAVQKTVTTSKATTIATGSENVTDSNSNSSQ